MKTKIIAQSLLWASLMIATAVLLRHTEHQWTMFFLLLTCSSTSIALLAERDCPRKSTADHSPSGDPQA